MNTVAKAEKALWRSLDDTVSHALIDRVDPRARIVAAVLFAGFIVSLNSLLALGGGLGMAIFAMAISGTLSGPTLRRVAAMDAFIIFMLIILPFTTPGTTMFTLWGLPASEEGLFKAIEIMLKANAVVMVLLSQVGTMEATTLGHALHRLRCPEKLIHLMLFTVRYLSVLHEEYLRMRTAMRTRGFRPRSNLHTYKSFGYLLGMMLVRSLERSERILEAMKCRGFRGRFFLLDDERLTPADGVYGVIVLAVLSNLIALEVFHDTFI